LEALRQAHWDVEDCILKLRRATSKLAAAKQRLVCKAKELGISAANVNYELWEMIYGETGEE